MAKEPSLIKCIEKDLKEEMAPIKGNPLQAIVNSIQTHRNRKAPNTKSIVIALKRVVVENRKKNGPYQLLPLVCLHLSVFPISKS